MELKNKNIVITGASGGIASFVAENLVKEGANLALLDLNNDMLVQLLTKLNSPNSIYYALDVSDINAVEQTFKDIKDKFGHIDALINAAGIQAPIGQFYTNNLNSWKKNIEVNLLGTVYCTQFAVNLMIPYKKGKIINFSGGGSTSTRNSFSAYAVAKTGVVRFTETVAEELKEFNIDINAISPGAVNTNMLDEVIKKGPAAGKEYEEALKQKESGGTDPIYASDLITFLCSDKSDGITGKLISANWDDWKNPDVISLLIKDKDYATLRRIDNKYFQRKA